MPQLTFAWSLPKNKDENNKEKKTFFNAGYPFKIECCYERFKKKHK